MAEDDPKGPEPKKQRRSKPHGAKTEAEPGSAGDDLSAAEPAEEESEEEITQPAETAAASSRETKRSEAPDRGHAETGPAKKSKGYAELMRVEWKPKKRRR